MKRNFILSCLLFLFSFSFHALALRQEEIDGIVSSVVDDVYRKAASDCSVAALTQDVQSILNKLNIIVPQINIILTILNRQCCDTILSRLDTLTISAVPCTVSGLDTIEQLISEGDALILSKLDNLNINVSTLPCTVSGLDTLERLVSQGDALILSKLDTISFSATDQLCCSQLESLISKDDAQILSKLDTLESLIENVSVAVNISFNDLLLSALESPCAAIAVTTNTTITSPGYYCLANNLVSDILISTDDVVVDLNSHVVAGSITIGSPGNLRNITIRDGVVRSTSAAMDAIVVIRTTNLLISNVRCESGLRGLFLGLVGNAVVNNCEFISNVTGIALVSCAEVSLEAVRSKNSLFSGFSLLNSYTNTIRECQSIGSGQGNLNEINNNVYGFVVQNSSSNIFENCIANATQALSTTDYSSIIAGFALLGNSNSNKIIGCEAANGVTNSGGVTVPYGIYLQPQFDGLISVTVESIGNTVRTAGWSPDGIYLAVGGDFDLKMYQFNRVSQNLTLLDSIETDASDVRSVTWSPNGQYLAIGTFSGSDNLKVYWFDRGNQSLVEVALANQHGGAILVNSVAWSPDGIYLALGGTLTGDDLRVYRFDTELQSLSEVDSVNIGGSVRVVEWSPDGQYLAVVGALSGDDVRVYRFDRGSQSLFEVDSVNIDPYDDVLAVEWSPDGQYLAAGGILTGDDLRIYRFDRGSENLSEVDSINTGGDDTVRAVEWSPDGRYLAIGGLLTGDDLRVYRFDRGSESLSEVDSINTGVGDTVRAAEWSPDGRYLAVGGTLTNEDLIIYSALSFPSENVIKDNTVYCNSGAQYPSGVGICGSSICNYIVGNTAYSNPINPSIVSSNYQFVCNVYNQLFELAPSLMQNIALGTCEPIALQDNTALLQKQTLARIGKLTDTGTYFSTCVDGTVIDNLQLDVISLLKSILKKLYECP